MTMKQFSAGEVLTAADLNEYCVNTRYIRKPVDESVVSSTTLQDDDFLTLPVDANKSYEFTLVATYVGATAGDMQWRLNGPSGTAITTASMGIQTAAAGSGDDLTEAFNQGLPISQNYGALPANKSAIALHGLIVVGGTAGSIQFQFAQVTSTATPTTVHAGSFMLLRRVS
jgi:hypothetical protein